MKLSVVMPCFNAAGVIAGQLAALARQASTVPWELLVSDNGSRDETRLIVERFRPYLPNLRLIDASATRGAAYARNAAIRAARSDHFAFCDADDEVGEGWVERMAEALETHEFVFSRTEFRRLNDPWLAALWGNELPPDEPIFGFLPGAATNGAGFTRALYEHVGPFDESLRRMSDIDYAWRVQLAGYHLHRVDDAVVHYRQRATPGSIFKQAYLDGQAQVRLYIKYRALGMSWRSFGSATREWASMATRLRAFRTAVDRARWLIDLGFNLGHARGSLRYRVRAL